MDLNENIHRIKTLMVEDKSIPNMIKTLGVSDAIKYFGSYETIKPYLKGVDKTDYIKEKVSELAEEFGGGSGISFSELYENPILYSENNYELRQIEYLGEEWVYVDVYDKSSDSHLGDFRVKYEDLPEDIMDEIFRVLIDN